MRGKTTRVVAFQMFSAIRSPRKEGTISLKDCNTSESKGIIEPETSRQSTMSRVAIRSSSTNRSTGRPASRAVAAVAPATSSAISPAPMRRRRRRRRKEGSRSR